MAAHSVMVTVGGAICKTINLFTGKRTQSLKKLLVLYNNINVIENGKSTCCLMVHVLRPTESKIWIVAIVLTERSECLYCDILFETPAILGK